MLVRDYTYRVNGGDSATNPNNPIKDYEYGPSNTIYP